MIHLSPEQLAAMDRYQRMNLVNSLSGYKQPFLVGSLDGRNRYNLGLFNSLVHIGAHPARMGFFIRPLTVPRHTYHNMLERKVFTINLVREDMLDAAHQTSADYPWGVSEFSATGLTAWFSEKHPAPYVAESVLRIGMELEEDHRLSCNGNILVVGRVVELFLPEDSLQPAGHVDIMGQQTVGVIGLDTYFRANLLGVKPYARPT